MALSRPRKITVNGTLYHWKASGSGGAGNLHFVAIEPGTNRKIVVYYPHASKSDTITPQRVRDQIDEALASGWEGTIDKNY